MLFLNVSAGISIISQAAPMAMEITGVSALAAAGMVSIISVANGAGRLLWAWLSDAVGRKWVFLAMFLIQAVAFFLLPLTTAFAVFAALAFVVLLCYGGGFGTMPAFAADYFGDEARGRDLWADAHRLGARQCAGPAGNGEYPPEHGHLHPGALHAGWRSCWSARCYRWYCGRRGSALAAEQPTYAAPTRRAA